MCLDLKTAGEPGTYEFVYRPSGSSHQLPGRRRSDGHCYCLTGGSPEPVSAEVTGLVPGTRYTFCVRAGNEEGAEVLGAPETFTTPPVAPVVEAESSSEASATEARLQATINPGKQDRLPFRIQLSAGGLLRHEHPQSLATRSVAGLSGVSVSAVTVWHRVGLPLPRRGYQCAPGLRQWRRPDVHDARRRGRRLDRPAAGTNTARRTTVWSGAARLSGVQLVTSG